MDTANFDLINMNIFYFDQINFLKNWGYDPQNKYHL